MFPALLAAAAFGADTLSVLHIVADDLRPELGLYNSPNTLTPHLDALAANGEVQLCAQQHGS